MDWWIQSAHDELKWTHPNKEATPTAANDEDLNVGTAFATNPNHWTNAEKIKWNSDHISKYINLISIDQSNGIK